MCALLRCALLIAAVAPCGKLSLKQKESARKKCLVISAPRKTREKLTISARVSWEAGVQTILARRRVFLLASLPRQPCPALSYHRGNVFLHLAAQWPAVTKWPDNQKEAAMTPRMAGVHWLAARRGLGRKEISSSSLRPITRSPAYLRDKAPAASSKSSAAHHMAFCRWLSSLRRPAAYN